MILVGPCWTFNASIMRVMISRCTYWNRLWKTKNILIWFTDHVLRYDGTWCFQTWLSFYSQWGRRDNNMSNSSLDRSCLRVYGSPCQGTYLFTAFLPQLGLVQHGKDRGLWSALHHNDMGGCLVLLLMRLGEFLISRTIKEWRISLRPLNLDPHWIISVGKKYTKEPFCCIFISRAVLQLCSLNGKQWKDTTKGNNKM